MYDLNKVFVFELSLLGFSGFSGSPGSPPRGVFLFLLCFLWIGFFARFILKRQDFVMAAYLEN